MNDTITILWYLLRRLGRFISKSIRYSILIATLLICVIPFYLMINNSTRSSSEINAGISFVPSSYLAENYQTLNNDVRMFRGVLNSAVISLSATLLTVYCSALAAFGFTVYTFRFRRLLFAIVLGIIMVPPQLGLIGFFELMNTFGLIDTYIPLIIPAAANAFGVFFITQYAKGTLNKELLYAARIDGANEFSIFHRIALPLLSPGLATLGIFSFVANWNNYITPLVIIFSEEKYTVPMLIATLNSTAYKTDFGAVYLGIAISVMPILIFFIFASRYIIAGINIGGLKE